MIKNLFVLLLLRLFVTPVVSSGVDIKTSVTNEIHFRNNGSGSMVIIVTGRDFDSVARVFGVSKMDLSTNSLDYYLELALEKLDLKEGVKSVKTNAGSVTFLYESKFSTPRSVLEWFNDNVLVPGKHISWTDSGVDLQIRLSEVYDVELTLVFVFDGYTITSANGVVMNSDRVVWQPGRDVKTLHLEAKKTVSPFG